MIHYKHKEYFDNFMRLSNYTDINRIYYNIYKCINIDIELQEG